MFSRWQHYRGSKFRAMEIIEQLEPHTRGPYTGSMGYMGFNQMSQWDILIRAAPFAPMRSSSFTSARESSQIRIQKPNFRKQRTKQLAGDRPFTTLARRHPFACSAPKRWAATPSNMNIPSLSDARRVRVLAGIPAGNMNLFDRCQFLVGGPSRMGRMASQRSRPVSPLPASGY